MNRQLELYCQEVDDIEAPAAERLQTLYRRDGLEDQALAAEEQGLLMEADRRLLEHIEVFAVCTDFAAHRRQRDIPAQSWWWYLDAIIHTPRAQERQSVAGQGA